MAVLALVLAACGSDDPGPVPAAQGAEPPASPTVAPEPAQPDTPAPDPTPTGDGLYPDVLAGELAPTGDRVFTVSATLSSPYDSPQRYADGWRVVAPDGTVLGVRELLHDHAAEQPFTRSLSGVEIPSDIDIVTIEGRDRVNGWGGATVEVEVPPGP